MNKVDLEEGCIAKKASNHYHEWVLLKIGSGIDGYKYPDKYYCKFCLEYTSKK